MVSYNQRDSRWANQNLGSSNLKMGLFGCTTTAIADLSTYFGDNLNPSQVADWIKYSNGLVLWQSCRFNHFQFERREYLRNEANILAAIKDPNRAVLLQVDNGAHWVVATGVPNWFNWYIKIADPWFGDKADMGRYGNSITGAAYFKRN